MSEYSSKTVPQLKEILKKKNLSTEGKKADLIERLNQQLLNEVVKQVTQVGDEQQQQQQPENQEIQVQNGKSEDIVDDAAGEDPTLTVIQPKQPEAPKVLTAEERKSLAIELLNKKISRAVKFGDESAAEVARKDLNRVEKFGVENGTALAREIGIVDQGLPTHKRKFNKKFPKKNKSNFKSNHGSRSRQRSN
jgi:SAP domain-containing ribonucleoprotein